MCSQDAPHTSRFSTTVNLNRWLNNKCFFLYVYVNIKGYSLLLVVPIPRVEFLLRGAHAAYISLNSKTMSKDL